MFELGGWEFVGAMVVCEGSVVVARRIVDLEASLESIARVPLLNRRVCQVYVYLGTLDVSGIFYIIQ